MARNTKTRWRWPSMSLHWLIALLILGMIPLGMFMVELPKTPRYFWVYDLHKSIGLTILALMAVRLIWRLFAGAPDPEPGTPRLQNLGAVLVHGALYVMVFAMTLSGWMYDSASGLRALKYFGWFKVPKLTAPDPAIKEASHNLHVWGAWLLVTLVALHVAGALYHHFFKRDRTLVRMLPRAFSRD